MNNKKNKSTLRQYSRVYMRDYRQKKEKLNGKKSK